MEKFGFIYLWFDRKHYRFYVGSHWGKEDDGYICSSRWMRGAYKRRKEDFKRRIISKVYSSQNDLLIEEDKWLNLIKDDELGKKYYNLRKNASSWSIGRIHSEDSKIKNREKLLGNKNNGDKGLPSGVDRNRNKWRVRIKYLGKEKYVGLYNNLEEATFARNNAMLKINGSGRDWMIL